MRIMREYERPVHIKTYDVDTRRQLKLSTLLGMCQESSEQQLAQYGLYHTALMEQDMAFLLARVKIDFQEIPMEGQDVVLTVCPRGAQGAQYFREFQMFRDGKLMVEVMESWILVQMSTRAILPPSTMEHLQIDIESHRGKWNGRLGRIKMPADLPLLAERRIHYSDLDFNGHVSNIHYPRFLLESLPSFSNYNPNPELGMTPPKSLKTFSINYIAESKWGDVLQVYGCEDEREFFVYGQNDNGRSVECYGQFM